MATLEEYSDTDSDDEEYIPPGEHVNSASDSEDQEVSIREDCQVGNGKARKRKQDAYPRSTKKSRPEQARLGKRKGGIKLHGSDDDEHDAGSGSESGGITGNKDGYEEKEADLSITKKEEKSRIDDLWASFKKDVVGSVSSPSAGSLTSQRGSAKPADVSGSSRGSASGGSVSTSDGSKDSKTVTVKKSYDFAGEEVIVEQEVSMISLEKCHKQSEPGGSGQTDNKIVLPGKGLEARAKRSSGLSSVLKSLDKKPKMSTLEKSRLDWLKYKKQEGLEDELMFHAKDGFLERREFLQRTDLRQFEQERDERLKRFKRLY